MSGTSEDIFAEPMLDSDDYLMSYTEDLLPLLEDGTIPDLEEEKKFKVYSIKGNTFGSHKSIVLTADDERFFTIELGFMEVDGVNRIYPVTEKLSSALKGKLIYHGEITTTSGDLISKAVAVMKKFGSYFKFSNNCQDYCNYYLEEIGCIHAKTLTDGDKVVILAIAGAIMAIFVSFLRALR